MFDKLPLLTQIRTSAWASSRFSQPVTSSIPKSIRAKIDYALKNNFSAKSDGLQLYTTNDLLYIIANYGGVAGQDNPFDFDGDGIIGSDDVITFLSMFGNRVADVVPIFSNYAQDVNCNVGYDAFLRIRNQDGTHSDLHGAGASFSWIYENRTVWTGNRLKFWNNCNPNGLRPSNYGNINVTLRVTYLGRVYERTGICWYTPGPSLIDPSVPFIGSPTDISDTLSDSEYPYQYIIDRF